MKFKKSDLRDGDIVQYSCGLFRTVKGDGLYDDNDLLINDLDRYDENLKNRSDDLTIVKVYRLIWKYEESTITSDEKIILQNIDSKFKYVARDKDDMLYLYEMKPSKFLKDDYWDQVKAVESFTQFSHLFQMVKWEDDEPWAIEDLLKLPEKDEEA